MKRQRRTFSTEFKHDAAALVVDQGYTLTEACRSLDVGGTALRHWVDQLLAERGGITPKNQAMTAEQQRIQSLEAQVRRLGLKVSVKLGEVHSDSFNSTPLMVNWSACMH